MIAILVNMNIVVIKPSSRTYNIAHTTYQTSSLHIFNLKAEIMYIIANFAHDRQIINIAIENKIKVCLH